MKVTTGPQSPLIPTSTGAHRRTKLALIGGAFGLFALVALGTALVLEGPKRVAEEPAPAAVAPAKAAATKKISSSHGSTAGRGAPLNNQAS